MPKSTLPHWRALVASAKALVERVGAGARRFADALEEFCKWGYWRLTADAARTIAFWATLLALLALPGVRWLLRTDMAALVAWLPDCLPGGTRRSWADHALCRVGHPWFVPFLRELMPWLAAGHAWGTTLWVAWWLSSVALRWGRAVSGLWPRAANPAPEDAEPSPTAAAPVGADECELADLVQERLESVDHVAEGPLDGP